MSQITEAEVRAALREITRSDAVCSWDVNFDFRRAAIDSLDHATLALLLEERHGITISDDELAQLRTIGSFVKFAAEQSAA
jgi:acyl carrier protein